MRRLTLMLAVAAGSILLGVPYALRAFGPTEAEVVDWGQLAIVSGAILAVLVLLLGRSGRPAARLLLALGYGWVAAMQVLPIVLWILFHGAGISDGSPPSAFVAHWAYALPHAAVLLGSVGVIARLLRRQG